MKSPWPIRALVAAIVVGIVVLIARNTYWEDVTIPSPLRGEAVTNPFYAAQKFADELGATTQWRQTLGTLTGSTDVLVLMNWHWSLIEARRREIEAWVEAGGRLVVDDTLVVDGTFADWAGVSWSYPEIEEDAATDETAEAEADAQNEPPATVDVDLCATLQPIDATRAVRQGARSLSVCTLDGYGFLETTRDIQWGYTSNSELQAVRVEVGSGSVTVLNLSPFGNRDLTEVDHGELFVAATQLREGTRIAFLSESEHASLFALMWQYGAPVCVLLPLVIAALLWRASVRFGPLAPPTDSARRSLADQIRGTGRFAIRLGDGKALHAASVRSVYEAARRRIARYEVLSQEERIAAIAAATGLDAETLAGAINHTGPRRANDLAHTIALLETARRKLLE